jgi:signal transduction histidine kinase
MGNILSFIRNHLSLKVLLVMSVSVTVVMGSVIYLNTKYQQRHAKESMKTFGRELKFLTYAGLKHPMSVGDSSSVKQQLLSIDEITNDVDIVICDFRQRIVFANHEGEINRDISHFIHNKEALALLRDLLQTGNPYYEKLFEEEVDGKKYLITIHRMLNAKECHHCHGATRKNLGGMIVRQSTDGLYASMADLRNRSLLISLLGIVTITCLIYIIIARLVTRPVADLSEKAGRVAGGDLSVYFDVKTDDSIGTLGRSFDSMVKTIKSQHDELKSKIEERSRLLAEEQQQSVKLNIEIADRERVEEELRLAKDEAEDADRLKSEFLASMSCQIRTPMNSVIGMTDLLMDTDLTKKQREYVKAVNMSAKSLLTITSDILDFSKFEARKLELDSTSINLRDGIGDILNTLVLRASEKGLELAYHVPPEVPDTVIGDPGRLRQIIINLVGNAIKFTEAGEVVVAVSLEEETEDNVVLHFTVADTGIGIPAEKQKHIFDAFAQTDSSPPRRQGGTGLGLTISSKLVEMMGGRIWVNSEAGKGSAFHFTVRLGLQKVPLADT